MDINLNPCMLMDMRLKACSTTTSGGNVGYQNINNNSSDSKKQLLVDDVDRLSGLPDELLIRILSLLPTKDAAVASLASKRLRGTFPLITTLDIADIPVSGHPECRHKLKQFPSFATFVDTVLQAHQSESLTSFRLGVGSDVINKFRYHCSKKCLPAVKPTSIHSWISFPLTRCCGLKELDLRIHMRRAADGRHQLPPEIFTCETLEVLKLDVNLRVHQISTFRLPKLKVLYLNASHIYGDGSFVAKLVSSCPLLEDLTVHAKLDHVQSIVISSPSLRMLNLMIATKTFDHTDFLRIHTPSLEYLHFCLNLALQQSVTKMDHVTKAVITIVNLSGVPELSHQQILGIISSLPYVHHLCLLHMCLRDLNVDLLNVQLPIFRNLKYLELGHCYYTYWEKVLVPFLDHSPVLETLVFPEGMVDTFIDEKDLQMEQEFCRRGLAIIPQCCRSHLKRIVIKHCYGISREIDLIQFLLKHALVLEELVVFQYDTEEVVIFYENDDTYPIVDKIELQKTIQSLPRASVTCSIQVQSASN